jgi:predicted dehydrogenase
MDHVDDTTTVTIAVVGAGSRGSGYARLAAAVPGCREVAVAEPDPVRRAALVAEHEIPAVAAVDSWSDLAAGAVSLFADSDR